MKPQISFVMPQKNRGDRIRKSIEAILNQTIPDWELIIIDDHSDEADNTEKIITEINDQRIRFFRMPRNWPHGIPSARNFGNMFAESEIIAVADSDDLSKPERAQKTLEYYNREHFDVFFGSYEIYLESEQKLIEPKNKIDQFSPDMLKVKNYISHSSCSYRREIALQFPYNSFFGKGEDYDLFARLALNNKKFSYCPDVIFRYVVHGENYSGGKKVEEVDALIKLNEYDIGDNRQEIVNKFIEVIYN